VIAGRQVLTSQRRRALRLCAVVGAVAGLVVVVGVAKAALVVAAVAMVWAVVTWPRWEARLFGAASSSAPVRPEVWARPVPPPAADETGRAEAHRAYARALHAVTSAYLAECEREAGR
jgi:hypothetical protein